MKQIIALLLVGGLLCGAVGLVVSMSLKSRHATELARAEAARQSERAALQKALAEAEARARFRLPPAPVAAVPEAVAPSGPTAFERIARLQALAGGGAVSQGRPLRTALYQLEELIAAGPNALPAVRAFLGEKVDVDFVWPNRSRRRGESLIPPEMSFPPSLRFGLFDVVRQIGGDDAELILAEVLQATGRGAEVAWLARTLQGTTPDRYRAVALATAHRLLSEQAPPSSSSPLDADHRAHLFSVLTLYGDTSYVEAAQDELINGEGRLDRTALNYLHGTLGRQAVPIVARAYYDERFTEPGQKEPLVRLALTYVGSDSQANDFYLQAVNDLTLSKSHRENLIEDLNEDGFPDKRNITPTDLPLIEGRIAFIEQVAPGVADPANQGAFAEAYKDLINMRGRLVPPPEPNQ